MTDGPAEWISLTDTLIAIDALGCQKAIAEAIVDGGGDFVMAVKDNQPTLREAIATHFEKHLEGDFEDQCGTGTTRRTRKLTDGSTSGRIT